jgi:hypothetical protein
MSLMRNGQEVMMRVHAGLTRLNTGEGYDRAPATAEDYEAAQNLLRFAREESNNVIKVDFGKEGKVTDPDYDPDSVPVEPDEDAEPGNAVRGTE